MKNALVIGSALQFIEEHPTIFGPRVQVAQVSSIRDIEDRPTREETVAVMLLNVFETHQNYIL